MNGPLTKVGMMLMKSKWFFSANSHAAFSASVFETKYICKMCGHRTKDESLICTAVVKT